MISRKNLEILGLFLANLIARLPFLAIGYGREEDAWGHALTAKNTFETGIYEVSRLPGHPLYELLLAFLWPINHSYFLFNLFSAFVSAMGVIYFYKALLKINAKIALPLALTFGFIPVFFITGTYTIDYNFALLFLMISFYQLMSKKIILAGILLGIAVGFRISSAAFLIPWILMYPGTKTLRSTIQLSVSAVLVSILCFLPPFITYGIEFLDFHKPPYASWAKIAFKLSFGIWGLFLFGYLVMSISYQFFKKAKYQKPTSNFTLALVFIIISQLAIFFRLPFKSEFLIPALPFILIFLGVYLNKRQLKILPYVTVLSCFLFGFDYLNTQRGSPPSAASVQFEAGGKTIYFDIAQGPAVIDLRKRAAKLNFISQVKQWMNIQEEPVLIIAGWYWPQLELRKDENPLVKLDYYCTEEEILEAQKENRAIYYLPEINEANAKIEGHYLANRFGTLLNPE